jgi:hypothetical protein
MKATYYGKKIALLLFVVSKLTGCLSLVSVVLTGERRELTWCDFGAAVEISGPAKSLASISDFLILTFG